MLNHADALVRIWHTERGKTFGINSYSLKAHQMLHLVRQVKENGPLWATSCFFGNKLNFFLF